MKDIEIRNYGGIDNFNEETRTISGYALKFDTPSQYMGFYEKIDRSAINEELIKKSDIFALFNHDENKVLARSRYGEGSLKLEIREDGLYYEFEAPHTQWGDEVIEHLKRGEIFGSSFAFMLPLDSTGDIREYDENGVLNRTIIKIERLFDVSPVFEPAYLATTCSKRTLDILEDIENRAKEQEEVKDEDEKEEIKDEEIKDDDKEQVEEKEQEQEQEETKEDEDKEDEKEEKSLETNEKNINKKEHNIMEKQFSLLRAIRAIANNQKLNDVDAAVINAGAQEFRKAGVEFGGQIQLPNMIENRAAITVAAEGEDVVATDIYDILTPLRARNVLVQAGAKFMTGLVGNVQVPIMSASNVSWEGETASAQDGAGTFTNVTLSPKRLTAYIDISKQFLVQDGVGAEAVIREDLIKAINSKLESTILGSAAGTTTQPAGIFYGNTPATVADFGDVCDVEAGIEEANVIGELKYIVSPKTKAVLRGMIKGQNGTGMVYENDSVDGTPALVTTNVAQNKYVVGDFANLAIGQWGAIDLTVDPYTKAADGQVRLVINAFFDAKVLRAGAFGFGNTGE
jgi:HK97 family phage major capsid protein/HK97 family phage prohead protease